MRKLSLFLELLRRVWIYLGKTCLGLRGYLRLAEQLDFGGIRGFEETVIDLYTSFVYSMGIRRAARRYDHDSVERLSVRPQGEAANINDYQTKPVLFCSCSDNTVRLYDLPSFTERGRLYSKHEVSVIQRGPFPLFFTGDGNGSLTVWKWLQKPGGGAP
ncbi:hypothetical protein QQP08_002767 [Theobroma cacao]|nr:hypothetical protein QQP08_002767 [Theobroma cacao]